MRINTQRIYAHETDEHTDMDENREWIADAIEEEFTKSRWQEVEVNAPSPYLQLETGSCYSVPILQLYTLVNIEASGEVYEVEIFLHPITIQGYYSGYSLDYVYAIAILGEETLLNAEHIHDTLCHSVDWADDEEMYPTDMGTCIEIEKQTRYVLDEIRIALEKVYSNISTNLLALGTMSNGEEVYKQIKP